MSMSASLDLASYIPRQPLTPTDFRMPGFDHLCGDALDLERLRRSEQGMGRRRMDAPLTLVRWFLKRRIDYLAFFPPSFLHGFRGSVLLLPPLSQTEIN